MLVVRGRRQWVIDRDHATQSDRIHRACRVCSSTVRGSAPVDQMSDEEMLRLIIGRTVETTFPDKLAQTPTGTGLAVTDLSSQAFHDINLVVEPGEIVGLAGVAGNGQAELLRALAGLEPATGEVRLGGRALKLGRPAAARR